jgi:hypothetical protein
MNECSAQFETGNEVNFVPSSRTPEKISSGLRPREARTQFLGYNCDVGGLLDHAKVITWNYVEL